MRNKAKSVFLAGVAMIIALASMTSNADVIFDTLPRNDQAGLIADCGQTWMTAPGAGPTSLSTELPLDENEQSRYSRVVIP